ncbi:hypothetical protein H8E88_24095 [candidate division KSB1 bacterium]|nr:hypothetical protein [candidate division KSB1 bacterium]
MNNFEQSPHLNSLRLKKMEVLNRLETKAIKKKSFRYGFVFGFFTTYILLGIIIFSFFPNKQMIIKNGLSVVVSGYFKDVVKAFPDGYITRNKEKVITVFDSFVNGAAKNRVSNSEYRRISQQTMIALQDGVLKYQELDAILELMEQAVKSSH